MKSAPSKRPARIRLPWLIATSQEPTMPESRSALLRSAVSYRERFNYFITQPNAVYLLEADDSWFRPPTLVGWLVSTALEKPTLSSWDRSSGEGFNNKI